MSFVGAIVGARRSGKTSLALDLLLSVWRYRFDMIVIMSRTITLQEDVASIGRHGRTDYREARHAFT